MAKTSLLLIAALLFCLAYGQAPLYYSNQNQYFLHGLARAEVGLLADDWLANTQDPTPLFSLLVEATARHLDPFVFHVYYAILMVVFFLSLVGIFAHLAGERDSVSLRLVFAALALAAFSALGRWLSQRIVALDLPWYLQAGVAGQYVLGAMFQPSTFGVLLVLAIALFVNGRPYLAAVAVSGGATMHTTYLLPAAFLTVGFMTVLWREGQGRRAALVGLAAFLLVLPITIFVALTFGAASSADFFEAQRLLVHVRIPHHCLPELWLDKIALAQIAWMALGVAFAWGTRLFLALLVPMLLGAGLTVLQVVTESDTLALLFPWRISAVVMPVATTLILGRVVLLARPWLERRESAWVGAGVMLLFALGGLWIMVGKQGYQSMHEEMPLLDHVWETKRKGDVYLIPVDLPDLKKTTRGSLSSDFKPLAERRKDQRLIPVDLMRFRLYTEAPIYVDFKAIPYQEQDMLEWKRRLDRAKRWQDGVKKGEAKMIRAELEAAGVTHLVVDAEVSMPGFNETYRDRAYRIYGVVESK